jgi:stage IV sporulation protein A
MGKPFVIVLNTKDPASEKAKNLAKELEGKYEVSVLCLSALNLVLEDVQNIILKALEEFPIKDLEIMLPDYLNVLGDEIELKNEIMMAIKDVEMKYTKIKDVRNICNELELSNQFSEVKLDLLDISTGDAKIILNLDDSKYKQIVDDLLGEAIKSRKDFVSYLYKSKNANSMYEDINQAILEAKESGYGISIPKSKDMKLVKPEVVKRNGMYGVKLAAKATCLHIVAVDVEASFTPIIGSLDQSNMLMNSFNENGEESDVWEKEFFGKKLSDIVNDSMKSKIIGLPDKSKDKIKNVLERLMNSSHNNLIAIII